MALQHKRPAAMARGEPCRGTDHAGGLIFSTNSTLSREAQLDAVASACGGWLQANKVRCPICGGKLSVGSPTRGHAPLLQCWGGGCSFDDLKAWLVARGAWNGCDGDRGRPPSMVVTRVTTTRIDWREIIDRSVPNHPRLIRYLRSRGLSGNYDPTLRLLEAKDAAKLGLSRRPHMVALLMTHGAEVTGCQTTELAVGSPGRVKRPGAKLSHGRVRGSAVILPGGHRDDKEFIIGEGVENVASACELLELSGCATLGAYNLRDFTEPPLYLPGAILLVDRDSNGIGQRCAKELAAKLLANGTKSVRLWVPPLPFKDWNDYVLAQQ